MDALYHRIYSSFSKQNFLALIGAELECVEPGSVQISCRRQNCLTQQQGFLHGGVVDTIADVTCGYTALTVIPEGREVLGAETKINFLRPVTGEKITAKGHIIKAGNTLIITEAEVWDEGSGKLVAKMLATMVPSPVPPSSGAS